MCPDRDSDRPHIEALGCRVFVRRGTQTRACCVGTIHATNGDPLMRLRSLEFRCACSLVLVESAEVTAVDNNSVTFGCGRSREWVTGDIVGALPWAKDRDGTGFGGSRVARFLRRGV